MITLSEICRFRLTDPVLGDLRHQQGLGNETVADECLGLHQHDAASASVSSNWSVSPGTTLSRNFTPSIFRK